MITSGNIQSVFLEQVRVQLRPGLSFADELAETLHISRDSAYRRIRCETILSLDEAKVLCNKYGVSLDSIIAGTGGMVSFHYRMVDGRNFTFDQWLKSILVNLEMLVPFHDKQLIYFAKDIPVFYYFNSPLLGKFKMFFWLNSVLRDEYLQGTKFGPSSVPGQLVALGEKIWKQYTETPRTEIWSDETLNVTLRQIEFYHECGFFEDPEFARQLCDEYSTIINEIKGWAALGYKVNPDTKFNLYKNDLLIADNTIFFRMGDRRVTFIPYNTMNILTTSQDAFCKQTEDYLVNLTSKSILISTTGEKERNKFFNQMQDKIQRLKARLL